MQFYMIHPDPKISADNLPNYCILKVNCREGWQILSDIGHILGVHWEGQNKCYSKSHAKTLSLCSSKEKLRNFLDHYRQSLIKYEELTGKRSTWHQKFFNTPRDVFDRLLTLCPLDEYQQTIIYLLSQKKDKMSNEDYNCLFEKFVSGELEHVSNLY